MKSPIRYAPLSSGFMVTSIVGFLISIWMVMDWSETWGFTLALFFVMLFIASFVSMSKAEPIPEHMDELAIHRLPRSEKVIKKRDTSPHYDKIKWYEPLLVLYLAAWAFFVIKYASGNIDDINQVLSMIFVLATIVLMVFFISDALSNERLSKWEQLLFTVLLVFTSGLGIFIYYLYKRMKS